MCSIIYRLQKALNTDCSRLVKITAAVIGLFIVLLPFARDIFETIAQPLVDELRGQQMQLEEIIPNNNG